MAKTCCELDAIVNAHTLVAQVHMLQPQIAMAIHNASLSTAAMQKPCMLIHEPLGRIFQRLVGWTRNKVATVRNGLVKVFPNVGPDVRDTSIFSNCWRRGPFTVEVSQRCNDPVDVCFFQSVGS